MATDTTERGLERLICAGLAGHPCDPPAEGTVADPPAGYGGVGWSGGNFHDYDREYGVDLVQLSAFLRDTQPEAAEALALSEDGPTRRAFLTRLQGEIAKRGTIEVLRNGIKHGALHLDLFYGTPSAHNPQAQDRFEQNRFTVTRQLRYSRDEAQRALDIGLFINGLPVFTFELKNSLTKQTVDDAVLQYQQDRNPREKLFEFGRCIAHFAVDEREVQFCTRLAGKASWFLPFNRGWNDGAGNPPNPEGLAIDYLWREVLTRRSLTDILENYAQVVEAKDEKSGRKRRTQIWPRYHQLDVVRRLLADAGEHGAGRRYLIQHSAGSGKSNSIAWLAHQLIGLTRDDAPVFDSIIVVTDRVILDRQIRDTIKHCAQVGATVGHAARSVDLRGFIESISTVQKFTLSFDTKVAYRVDVAIPRVYVETLIPSFYVEGRTAPDVVARREWTRQRWADAHERYELVISTAVLDELAGDVPERSAQRLALVHGLPLLPVEPAVIEVVEAYIRHKVMPADPSGDALHLALASFQRCDFLVPWNCRHLANANKFGHIRRINVLLGLFVPALVTPLELIGGSDEAE